MNMAELREEYIACARLWVSKLQLMHLDLTKGRPRDVARAEAFFGERGGTLDWICDHIPGLDADTERKKARAAMEGRPVERAPEVDPRTCTRCGVEEIEADRPHAVICNACRRAAHRAAAKKRTRSGRSARRAKRSREHIETKTYIQLLAEARRRSAVQ